jgi:hypothetical protein
MTIPALKFTSTIFLLSIVTVTPQIEIKKTANFLEEGFATNSFLFESSKELPNFSFLADYRGLNEVHQDNQSAIHQYILTMITTLANQYLVCIHAN